MKYFNDIEEIINGHPSPIILPALKDYYSDYVPQLEKIRAQISRFRAQKSEISHQNYLDYSALLSALQQIRRKIISASGSITKLYNEKLAEQTKELRRQNNALYWTVGCAIGGAIVGAIVSAATTHLLPFYNIVN